MSCAHKVHTTIGSRKDGRTDGRTDIRTDGRTDLRKDGKPKTMSLRFSSKRRGKNITCKKLESHEIIRERTDSAEIHEVSKIEQEYNA